MTLEIVDEHTGSLEILTSLPTDMDAWVLPAAEAMAIQGDTFWMLMQAFQGEGFTAWYTRYHTDRATILRARGDIPVLELRIAWENELVGTWDNILEPVLPPYHFNLSFTPHVATRAVLSEGQRYSSFDIHFEIDLLTRLGIDYARLDDFLSKVAKGQPAELASRAHPCPVDMIAAVKVILKNAYSVPAQKHIIDYKVKEILLTALEAVTRIETGTLPVVLHPRDIEALHQVKAIIERKVPGWMTPEALCREVGLNELKLKVGFKHLFGITPYDYHVQLKMQEARTLLHEGQHSVATIAYLTGYEHPSSFCREFKKSFGFTPGYYRKFGIRF